MNLKFKKSTTDTNNANTKDCVKVIKISPNEKIRTSKFKYLRAVITQNILETECESKNKNIGKTYHAITQKL